MSALHIRNSERLQEMISALVAEAQAQSQSITGVQPANPEKKDHFAKQLAAFAGVRGRPLFFDYVSSGLGHGPYVQLEDGSVKIDLINGIGVHILGHSHPALVKASIEGSLEDVVNQGHLQAGALYQEVSQKLVDMAKGSRLKHCWLTTCGTMANENALKMARQKNSPAKYVLAMANAFSGRSTMMAEITDNPNYKQGLPNYNEVLRVPFYDKFDAARSQELALQDLRKHIAEHPNEIAMFCFEPILGEGGYRVAPLEYYRPLLEECKQNNIAIWADEVQTFLRTGEAYAFQSLGFGDYVDICTVAKTAQIGATLYTEEYNPKPGLIAGTFAGATAALSSGMAVLEEMSGGSYFGENGRVAEIHKVFTSELQKICEGSCKGLLEDPDGMGLMVAVTPFGGNKEKVMKLIKHLFKNGVICFGCGKVPFRIRFLVPAIITNEQIKEAVSIMEKTILEVAKEF